MKYLKRFNEISEYSDVFNKEEFIKDIEDLVVDIEDLGYEVSIEHSDESSRQFELGISIVTDDTLGKEEELKEIIAHIIRYARPEGLLISLKTYWLTGYSLELRDICVDETEIFREIKDKKGKNKEVAEIVIELFKKKDKL